MPPSKLEEKFAALWDHFGGDLPNPLTNYAFVAKSTDPRRERFVAPTGRVRQWKFDAAWPAHKVAVELEGGIFSTPVTCNHCKRKVTRYIEKQKRHEQVMAVWGGHTRGAGYQDNCLKYNAASVLGWRLLRYTTKDLQERPDQVLEEIIDELNRGPKVAREKCQEKLF